jgi:hypothetical protein
MLRHLARAACVLVIAAGSALAGDASGKLELPAPPALPEPAYPGFLARAENVTLAPKPFDPTPFLVVVLEPATAAAAAPASAAWDLGGDSFTRPLLTVRTGAEVTIRNKSKRAISVTTDDEKLIPAGPINPGGTRPFTVKTPGLVIVSGDADLPHLRGRLLVVDSPYFATPDKDGKFTIKDVPAGEYKVRIWYLDGWLDRTDDTLTMPAKGDGAVSPKLTAYKTKAP